MKKVISVVLFALSISGCAILGGIDPVPDDRAICADRYQIPETQKDDENIIRCHKNVNYDCDWYDAQSKSWAKCDK